MATADDLTSSIHANDGIVNRGYQAVRQDEISDEEIH